MSRTIDERVVSMQFDNKQFESNVQTSLGTIEKLKQSLNFKSASKGLSDLDAASRRVDMSALGNAAQTVGLKFSAMYTVADQAFRNITNAAMATGKRIVSAFTIDPVKTGLAEYETQINAVQTILANTQSKGTTLNDVNAALDELNAYADKTIYNFTEMTRNIGTFTAAGVDLDTATNAIQGIANLAAVSGSTSQQASTAMYQLSQALASGTVKLMDWNSVVNAGMGGQVFQDALKETARVHGVSIDNMIKKQGSFRETLSEGWLTSEILTETLQKFTLTTEGLTEAQIAQNRTMLKSKGYTDDQIDEIFKLGETATNAATKVKTFTQLMDTLKEAAQSGWTQTWEILIGDFEEAKALWTNVSDAIGGFIGKMSDSRNKLLEGAMTSNWEKMVKKINAAGIETSAFEEKVKSLLTQRGYNVDKLIEKYGSLEEVFKSGAIHSDTLKSAVKQLEGSLVDLSGINKKLAKGDRGDDVKKIQEALKSLNYDIGKTGVDGIIGKNTEAAIKAFQKAQGLEVTGIVDEKTLAALQEATKGVEGLTDSVSGLIDGITELGGREKLIESFKNIFKVFGDILKPIGKAFRDVFPPATSEQLYNLIDGFHKFTSNLKVTKEQSDNIYNTFKGLFSVFDIGWSFIKKLAGGVVKLIGSLSGLGDGVLNITGSIGEWLSDWIDETDIFGTAIDGIVSFLQKAIEKIRQFASFIGSKFKMPGFEGFLSLMQGIWNVIREVGSVISTIGKSIGNALSTAFSSGDLGASMDLVNGGLFAWLLISVRKFIKNLTGSAEEGFGLFESLKEAVKGITDVFDSVRSALETWQQNLKASILLRIAAAIGILAAAIWVISGIDGGKLAASVTAITVLFGELMGSMAIFSRISGKFGGVVGVVEACAAMISISIAVLLLASALKTISNVSWEGLAKGVLGIAGLMAIVVVSMKYLSKSEGTVMKGASSMILLAAAVKIMASACKDLSKLNWEELGKGLLGITGILIAFGLFSKILSGSSKSFVVGKDGIFGNKTQKNMLSAGVAMVIVAGAMKIFASAMADFAELDWKELAKGGAAIGGLLLIVAGFDFLAGKSSKLMASAVGLLVIGGAMKIFASVMSDMSELSWDDIAKSLVSIGGLLLAIGVLLKVAGGSKSVFSATGNSLFSMNTTSNLISTGVALLAVSASLKILASVLKDIGDLSWESIAKGLVALGVSIGILAFGLKYMTDALPGAAALLVASAGLILLSSALKKMGSMSVGGIIKSLVTMAGAIAIIGIAGAVLAPVIPAILALAGAMALIGLSVTLVGVGLLAAAAGFTALAVAGSAGATAIVAALSIIVTGILQLIPEIARSIGEAVVAFCEAIGSGAVAIGGAVKAIVLTLMDVLVECIPEIADGLLKLLAAVLESLATYTPQIVDSLFDFLIALIDGIADRMPELIQSGVNLIMEFFSGVIDALSGLDVDVLLKGIAGVGLISGLMILLNFVAGFVPGAMAGVLGMGGVIAELALVIAAIGGLAQIPGFEWLIGEGAELIKNIGNALGGFVGGIIGGVAEGITASLPQIGTDLSTFMTNLQPFLDGAKTINESTLTGVSAIADIIMTLTKASLLEGITSWITGGSSLTTFGEQLVPFGTALKEFSAEVSGINEEAVTAAANAGSLLAKMAESLPNAGGVAAFFAGENDMSTFGTQLVSFGTSLKSFSTEVSGINEEAVTAAANAGKLLAEMANSLPNTGGLAAFFAGENDMTAFGTQLVSFGTSLKSFSAEVTGIDEAAVTAAANAGSLMAEMAASLPNTGGVAAFFAGDNDMATFGTQLVSFGTAMKLFSAEVAGIDEAAVTAAANAGSVMAEMASSLPNTGGVAAFFAGDNDMATFGTQLVTFGTAVKDFSAEVAGIDEAAVTAAATAGSTLADMAKNLPESGGLWSVFSADNDLSTFASEIKKFGKGMKAFSEEVADVDESAITSTAATAGALVDMANNLPSADDITQMKTFGDNLKTFGEKMSAFATEVEDLDATTLSTAITEIGKLGSLDLSGLESLSKTLSSVGTESVTAFVGSFTNASSTVSAAGSAMVESLISAITDKATLLKPTITSIIDATVFAIKSKFVSFYSAGSYLVDGFAMGITANTFKAKATAAAMASAALEAAKEALDENSPSKESYKVGAFFGEGFVNAMDDYGSKTYKAGYNVAAMARDGLRNAISAVGDLIENGMDTQPTIRPVLDLSEVTAGANSINGMLSMSPSIGVLSRIGSINDSMNRYQNGTNDDVISAIEGLGRKLGKPSGDIYNINGVTYDDGSNIHGAVQTLVHAAKVERRR